VAKCPNCQQVKVEHQKPRGMTQEIDIPTWKWEVINMDFITGLPCSCRQHDSIWVIVDRVIKSARFLVVKPRELVEDYACFTLMRLLGCMGFLCLSSQIEVLSLPLIFGSHFRMLMVLRFTLAQHFIHRWMARQSVPFRPYRTC